MQGKNKTLLFVHDSLPAEGISGMIIFLRHFTQLTGWDIHILVPENAYKADIVKQYPANFHVHTFPIRLFWWPTFREDIPVMVKLRIFVLRKLFKSYIGKIKPNVLVTVQYHYYSVAIAGNSKKTGIPLVCFLHDRWDLTSNNSYISGVRKHYAQQTLQKSNAILSVTENLISHYLGEIPQKAEVFYPIPSSNSIPAQPQQNIKHLIYAGTLENHHLHFFAIILPIIKVENWQLTVISNRPEKLDTLAQEFHCLNVLPAFKTNSEALEYMKEQAGVILVNYGLSEKDNPFAFHSFPSKFVEYCGLGKPILAVAPPKSPFYNFLKEKNWMAFMEQFSENAFKNILSSFSDEPFYQQHLNQVKDLRASLFNPQKIQSRFEEILTKANSK